MKNYLIYLIIIGLVILGIVAWSSTNSLGGTPISPDASLGTNSSVTATTTAKLLLAEASYVQLRAFSNDGFYDAYLSSTSTNLTTGKGLLLKASSTEIFAGDNLYTGNWYVIANGTTTISILQL